jgi:hypothetical protein
VDSGVVLFYTRLIAVGLQAGADRLYLPGSCPPRKALTLDWRVWVGGSLPVCMCPSRFALCFGCAQNQDCW